MKLRKFKAWRVLYVVVAWFIGSGLTGLKLVAEEDAKASLARGLDCRGPDRREELRADLAPREDSLEAPEQRLRLVQARDVQRHQHPIGQTRRGQRGTPAGS